ncbi:hypothetical protein [Candidatus Lokiarchaeum ossiferum]
MVKKTTKAIKGVPIEFIKKDDKIVTTEENVSNFLKTHSDTGFSIEMLQEYGFSSNIRKIISKLLENQKIVQSSYQEEGKKKWEYLYFHKVPASSFELEKTGDGWKVEQININGFSFKVLCEYFEEEEQVCISLKIPRDGDGLIYREISDDGRDWDWIGSVRFSEMKRKISNLTRDIIIFQELEDFWEFEVVSEGEQRRISKTRSIVIGGILYLWAGNVGFQFSINPNLLSVQILPIYREIDDEGNVIAVNYYDDDEDNEHYFERVLIPTIEEEDDDEEDDEDDENPYEDREGLEFEEVHSVVIKKLN